MTVNRLYYPPEHTMDVLREVTSGAPDIDDLAEQLDVVPKTASNKVHDAVILGLIERDDYDLSVSNDAKRIVQLQDFTPLRDAFLELPGVSEIIEKVEEGSVDVEEAGRLVSFETGSDAAAEETFRHYGRVYAQWMDFLDISIYSDGVIADSIGEISQSSGPLENPRGPSNPRVPPEKVFEALPKISQSESMAHLQDGLDYSER